MKCRLWQNIGSSSRVWMQGMATMTLRVLDASGTREVVAIHDARRASRDAHLPHDAPQDATTCPIAATKSVSRLQYAPLDDPLGDQQAATRDGSPRKTFHPRSSTRSTSRTPACQPMHRPLASPGRLWSTYSSPKQWHLQSLVKMSKQCSGDKLTVSFIMTT
jgi:hypothetical protein